MSKKGNPVTAKKVVDHKSKRLSVKDASHGVAVGRLASDVRHAEAFYRTVKICSSLLHLSENVFTTVARFDNDPRRTSFHKEDTTLSTDERFGLNYGYFFFSTDEIG